MKKYNTIALVAIFASLSGVSYAQSQATARDFWQDKPALSQVKTALQGFAFSSDSKGDDPLSLAISNGASIEVIEFLASQPGVDFKKDVHEGRTYLHSATAKGDAATTALLLKKGADMNFADSHGQTALTYAAFMGRLTLPVLQAFENAGLDLKKKYETKNNADILLMAIGSDKDFKITSYLLTKGLSLNVVDSQGNNAFNYAAKYGHVPTLKKLVAKGVKYNDKDLFNAAIGPFRSANTIDVFKYLVDDLKLNPATLNEKGQNVLHIIAVKNNQDDVINYFVAKGVDINQTDKEGNTPFIGAAATKDASFLSSLLPKVKNINAVDAKGQSALTKAVSSGTPETMQILLAKGANANVTDKEGRNLSYYLVQAYRGKGGRGFTGRAKTGDPNADFGQKLDLLLGKGVNFKATQADGSTLYHLAVEKNDPALFKQLAKTGIDINAKNKDGLTPLHKAAMVAKDDNVLKYLAANGGDKTAKSNFGETAFDLAKENENLENKGVDITFLK